MKVKPLPCPFCGRIPKFHRIPQELTEPELNAFWSLSCGDRKHHCPGNASSHGDKKADAVAEWNSRNPADVHQIPLSPQDKPPFVARCGTVMVLVQSIEQAGDDGPMFLGGLILEGFHFNDHGDYGPGDTVGFGPLTDHWRRISVNRKFKCSECRRSFDTVEEALLHKLESH